MTKRKRRKFRRASKRQIIARKRNWDLFRIEGVIANLNNLKYNNPKALTALNNAIFHSRIAHKIIKENK